MRIRTLHRPVWFSNVSACFGAIFLLFIAPGYLAAQELSGKALISALQEGGYNIYFRHAATDWGDDDNIGQAGDWKSCDSNRMRQLSDAGRKTAQRIGEAMRTLGIPVGEVVSSEYCRAAETGRLLGFGAPHLTKDVMNMRAASFVGGNTTVIERVRRVLSTPPPQGRNRIIVGHGNLMRAATGAYPDEGGSGIVRPNTTAEHGFTIVAELSAEDWMALASSHRPSRR